MADSEATLLRRELAAVHGEAEAPKGVVAGRGAALAERGGEIARLRAGRPPTRTPTRRPHPGRCSTPAATASAGGAALAGAAGRGRAGPPCRTAGVARAAGRAPGGPRRRLARQQAGVLYQYPLSCRPPPPLRAGPEDAGCVHELVSGFDGRKRMASSTAAPEAGRRPRCRARVTAPSPSPEGAPPGLVVEPFWVRRTYADIAHLSGAFFRFRIPASAVAHSRARRTGSRTS